MKTSLLLVAAALTAFSSVVACTAASEETGSSEANVTADVDHMFRRPDGNYDIWCVDGSKNVNVPVEAVLANNVCPYDPDAGASSSSSSSGSTSGNTSSSSSTSGNASSTSSSTGGSTSGNASSSGNTSGGAH